MILGLLFFLLCCTPGPLRVEALAADLPRSGQTEGTQSGPTDIVFQGKITCSLVRQVIIPFPGIIKETGVRCGQPVAEGEVLAQYHLTREAVAQIRRRISPTQISELETRLAETERRLLALGSKRREIQQLTQENMAPAQSLAQLDQEIQLLKRERTAIQERMQQEKGLAKDDLALLKHQLAVPVEADRTPVPGSLKAPIAGHVIWVHSDLKQGAELGIGTPCFAIGVMDPMIMRAQVHEIEAMQLSLGRRAEIFLESMPERKVEGTLSRLSWTPATPGLEQPSFYEIELTVPNPGPFIRDGLKGQAVIKTTQDKDRK